MGRARTIFVLALSVLPLAVPAAAQQPSAEQWTRYSPLVEQVQAVDGMPVPGGGLFALVVDPASGASRLDQVDTRVRDHYEKLEPPIPVDPFSGQMGLSVESNHVTDAYVSVGNPNGTAPSLRAAVFMRWHDDPGHWIKIASGTTPEARMIAPWGMAIRPDRSVFVADARAGTILHVPDFLGPRTGKVRITSEHPEYKPVGADEALPSIVARAPLGVTGIASCPAGGTPMCTTAGNLMVVNASIGILYEAEVAADGTTPIAPRYVACCFKGAQSLEFDAVSGDLLVAGHSYDFIAPERDRVWRVTQTIDYPWIARGCPFSMPSDATFADGNVFVASRAPLLEWTMDFVRADQSPFDAASACPMPNVARVLGTE